VNVNEAVRRLRVLAHDSRGERWGELFLALDLAMCDGGELPDDWRKHRFDDDSDQRRPARIPATDSAGH
jgi:hypothetical protein